MRPPAYAVPAALGMLFLVALGCDTQRLTDAEVVPDDLVVSVTVSPHADTLQVGDALQLTATVATSDNTVPPSVSWTSTNPSVAAVSSTGHVGALAVGIAKIRAKSGEKADSAQIVVVAVTIPVASVEVTPPTASVEVGRTVQLSAVARDANGAPMVDRTMAWGSSNASVASVSADGLVTGVAVGVAYVGALSGGKSDTATITVTGVPVASVALTPPAASVYVGKTVQLTAVAKDANGTPIPGRNMAWSSLNSSIARVTSAGLVTGIAAGTGYIVATSEGKSDTATITVDRVPVASVSVAPSPATVTVSGSVPLVATVRDPDGIALTDRVVTWASSNASVATVASSGVVTGIAAGAVTITATSEGKSGTSNVTVTAAAPPPPPPPPPPPGTSVWLSPAEIAALPTAGVAWERLLSDAAGSPGTANIADQDSEHDIFTLAAALTCVRVGQYCDKARKGVMDAIGTEANERWLAIGRNLGAYVIVADMLGMRADGNPTSDGTRVEQWIRGWPTRMMPDNNSGVPRLMVPFMSGSNAAAQEGFVYIVIAAYMRDRALLDRGWDAFRTYAGDPTAPDRENIDISKGVEDGWAHDNARPYAVNPKGSTKMVPGGLPGAGTVRRLDGSIINDMRRGGAFQWEPGFTQYPWTGLAGFIPAAFALQRAGYPALEVADRAVLRTVEYLWFLRTETGNTEWFNGTRGSEVVQLVNHYYGTAYPIDQPVVHGKTIGYTDWTHPRR